MDGNSTILADDRPALRPIQGDRQAAFLGPTDINGVDYTWWDEPRNALHTGYNPLSPAAFVRLGLLNPLRPAARKNGKLRGSADRVDGDVPSPTYISPSFGRPASIVGEGFENGHAAVPQAPSAAFAASAGAAPEVDRDRIPGPTKEDPAPKLQAAATADLSPVAAEQCPFDRLRELSKRVQSGDDAAMAEIHHLLDCNEKLWRHLGDVEQSTEAMLIEVAGGSPEVKECIRRSVVDLKVSLLSKQPTPLERMAVGRVIACWLFANFVDRWCGWLVKQGGRASDLAKLLEAAEKRYQTSLKSLALVREIERSGKRSRSKKSAAASRK